MTVLAFPIRDKDSVYRLQGVRDTARRTGMDVAKAERDFLAAGCTQQARNEFAERARRARMAQTGGEGPEAA